MKIFTLSQLKILRIISLLVKKEASHLLCFGQNSEPAGTASVDSFLLLLQSAGELANERMVGWLKDFFLVTVYLVQFLGEPLNVLHSKLTLLGIQQKNIF